MRLVCRMGALVPFSSSSVLALTLSRGQLLGLAPARLFIQGAGWRVPGPRPGSEWRAAFEHRYQTVLEPSREVQHCPRLQGGGGGPFLIPPGCQADHNKGCVHPTPASARSTRFSRKAPVTPQANMELSLAQTGPPSSSARGRGPGRGSQSSWEVERKVSCSHVPQAGVWAGRE